MDVRVDVGMEDKDEDDGCGCRVDVSECRVREGVRGIETTSDDR